MGCLYPCDLTSRLLSIPLLVYRFCCDPVFSQLSSTATAIHLHLYFPPKSTQKNVSFKVEKGLTRLLTLCVRILTLIEIVTRRALKSQGQTLAGLYEGNPNRRTNSPTANRILRAFHGIDCIRFRNKASPYITPLNNLQLAILAMLAIDEQVYQLPAIQSNPLTAFAKRCGALLATICYR